LNALNAKTFLKNYDRVIYKDVWYSSMFYMLRHNTQSDIKWNK